MYNFLQCRENQSSWRGETATLAMALSAIDSREFRFGSLSKHFECYYLLSHSAGPKCARGGDWSLENEKTKRSKKFSIWMSYFNGRGERRAALWLWYYRKCLLIVVAMVTARDRRRSGAICTYVCMY